MSVSEYVIDAMDELMDNGMSAQSALTALLAEIRLYTHINELNWKPALDRAYKKYETEVKQWAKGERERDD